MTVPTDSMSQTRCIKLERWLTAYVDDELDAVHTLEVEEHIETCAPCGELLSTLRATRQSLCKTCHEQAPSSLLARLDQTLGLEPSLSETSARATAPSAETASAGLASAGMVALTANSLAKTGAAHEPPWLKMRYVMPLAAAATLTLVFGVVTLQERQNSQTASVPSQAEQPAVIQPELGQPELGRTGMRPQPADLAAQPTDLQRLSAYKGLNKPAIKINALDTLVSELVTQHMQQRPPETTDPNRLKHFEPYIGVRVRRPRFNDPHIKWVGARMDRQAALLQYTRNQRRLTVYVFDPHKVPLQAQQLSARRIGKRNVYVGNVRGYAVAASEQHGVGYALVSDLSTDENAALLASTAN